MPKLPTINLIPPPKKMKRLVGSLIFPAQRQVQNIQIIQSDSLPDHPEAYKLTISKKGIQISCREAGGRRAAVATLRQIQRQFGRRLPCLSICDWPDLVRRGVMLDISRGRVPRIETLLSFAKKLSDFKINELQLYTEHTFAYRKHKSVWQSWGALTGKEIQTLDARCRELGIDLVPNQNSFGHLREFLADKVLKKLGEIPRPYEADTKDFLRQPTTLAPNHPGTLPFLRGLYDELLPNFSSQYFNVGCDETWDLGKGQSKRLCEKKGKGRVYLDFLKRIQREVSKRDLKMMFWGDIILKHPELIRELPKDVIALNWGYEANHPFDVEAAQFAKARISFYVCPGTSTWQTLIGKHDNALANLHAAAIAGVKHGAIGYLITDWGDGGHPQPLAVSWPMFAAGASLAWNSKGLDEASLISVLNRDVYEDAAGKAANAAMRLGMAHKNLGVSAPNETPLGSVIAAPKPEDRELFCRNGLKWFAEIPAINIKSTMDAILEQRKLLLQSEPQTDDGIALAVELKLAAQMATESCHFMLWQQAVAEGKTAKAKALAQEGISRLQRLERYFNAHWPMRNKATPKHSTPFLRWRMENYRRGCVE